MNRNHIYFINFTQEGKRTAAIMSSPNLEKCVHEIQTYWTGKGDEIFEAKVVEGVFDMDETRAGGTYVLIHN